MSFHSTNANICFLTILLIAGCGSDKGDVSKDRLKAMSGGELKAVVPVSGKVLVDGEPASGVLVQLWASDNHEKARKSATTGADGKYCWSTYIACDGIQPGTYKLTFKHLKNPKKENSEDLFKGRFSNVNKSKFDLTVEEGKTQQNVDYELTTK